MSLTWAMPAEPWGWLSVAAWVLVAVEFVVVIGVAVSRRGVLPFPMFAATLGVAMVASALDLVAVAASDGSGPQYATVGIGVGAVLIACVSFRPIPEVFRALIGLSVLALASLVVEWLIVPENLSVGTSNFVLAVMPTAVALGLTWVFDQHVRRQLDRTVVESTIDAPGTGPGILAVSTLARLDARVEALLDDVAAGKPASGGISAEIADAASVLGDELRSVLLADHELSWLQLAVADSAYLSPVVTISDPAGLATRIEPVQRSALLSAVWLIAAAGGGASQLSIDVALAVRPATASPDMSAFGDPLEGCVVSLMIAGTKARSIDTSVWTVLDQLGPRTVDVRATRILVTVDVIPAREGAWRER